MSKVPIIDVFLSIISVWWAIVLFNNDQLFLNVPQLYEPLVRVTNELSWGFVFMAAALIKLYGIFTEKAGWRRVGLLFSMLLYGIICAGHILSNEPYSPGTGVYFALTCLALWGIRDLRGVKPNGD